MNAKQIEKTLGRVAPTIVNVILASGETKALRPPAGTRKRWAPIMGMLERMEWRRLELQDAKGGILEIVDNEDTSAGAVEPVASGSDHGLLKTMIQAQREALTWQDKSVRAALDTCVQVMGQMAEAVGAIIELNRQERAQQAALVRELESALGAAAGGKGDDEQPQAKLLAALAPMFLQQLMGGAGPGSGTPPREGH